jgi:ABC-type transporter Mla subunit MlaD
MTPAAPAAANETLEKARQLLARLAAKVGASTDTLSWAIDVYGSASAAAQHLGITGADHDDVTAQVLDQLAPQYDALAAAQARDLEMTAALYRLAHAAWVAS